MSSKNTPVQTISYGFAHLVLENHFKYLNGKILTLIEAIGLPTKQEEALKALISQAIYGETGIYIDPTLNDAIHDAVHRVDPDNPTPAIKLEYIK